MIHDNQNVKTWGGFLANNCYPVHQGFPTLVLGDSCPACFRCFPTGRIWKKIIIRKYINESWLSIINVFDYQWFYCALQKYEIFLNGHTTAELCISHHDFIRYINNASVVQVKRDTKNALINWRKWRKKVKDVLLTKKLCTLNNGLSNM